MMTVHAQDIAKAWYGTLDIQGTKLRLVFNITYDGSEYSTTMDSPDQGAKGLPTSRTLLTKDSIWIEAESLKMEYKGKIAAAGNRIDGTFTQNGFSFPLRLDDTETKAPVEELRTQDPRDFPYYSEEVLFPNYIDSVALAGTLTMPYSADITHAVVLITGSGPQDRNEEVLSINHRPFLVLSDYLTRNGIAVFRYDDRGVGGSSGSYGLATIDDFARDASAAVDYLKTRPDLRGARIGLIGHSEGGMVAPMLTDSVDFMVLLAAPGTSTGQLLLSQSRLISEVSGVQDTIIEANDQMMRDVYTFMIDNPEMADSTLFNGIKDVFKSSINAYPEFARASIGDPEIFADQQARGLMSPWFRHFLNFVPYNYLSKVTKPVLALNGTLDLQVPYNENLRAIELGLQTAGNKDYELVALEGLNHMFQTAITGAPSEYRKLNETFNEEAMKTILDWVKGR
jgi:pimeloyl-ACP methyl ester carboxylesterase